MVQDNVPVGSRRELDINCTFRVKIPCHWSRSPRHTFVHIYIYTLYKIQRTALEGTTPVLCCAVLFFGFFLHFFFDGVQNLPTLTFQAWRGDSVGH